MALDSPIPGVPSSGSGADKLTRDYVLLHVRADARYLPTFAAWLEANWHIWLGFRDQANAIRARGRSHYAARTIAEYLRHQTMLREAADYVFKLNNNNVPDLARLYMALNSSAVGFFHLRGRE